MLLSSLSFAIMGILAHAVSDSCDWQVIAIARSLLAFVFAGLLVMGSGARLAFPGPPVLWMRSIAGSLSIISTFYALTRLPVSDVLTLSNMFPIWVALLSWPVLREAPSLRLWLCVLSGIAGVVLIQQPHLAEGNLATLAALAASLFTAIAMLGLNRLAAIDPRAIVTHFSAVAVVFCVAAFAVFDRPLTRLDAFTPPVLGMLLGLGLAATVGQISLTKAFTTGRPARVSVIALSQIIFAIVFEILVWGRSFNAGTLVGMALIIAPSAWLMSQGVQDVRTIREQTRDGINWRALSDNDELKCGSIDA
jgi:drug/metabolite transporter (DMT)-like permease